MPYIYKFGSELATAGYRLHIRYRRFLLPTILLVLLFQPSTRALTQGVLADAFIQVSAFVAATLTLYYGVMQTIGPQRISAWTNRYPFGELLFCATLGALPGCGGAIVVITQYTRSC